MNAELIYRSGPGVLSIRLSDGLVRGAAFTRSACLPELPDCALRRRLDAYFQGQPVGFTDLIEPLGSTGFTTRAWQAIRQIPWGTTLSYAELAAAAGSPGASRAAGRACAANRIAVLVPCHRVTPATGGVGGYAWGTDIKRSLLELEGALLSR
ncbi:methylated-DNA--[protein]-cysteine S-methyltransferase [Candidatus Fermentibacterales bacterium]|nr:methylated-DNA--[protein]-cysteine S-methyltransferase [Candidatus Fermentibacterales bacterium]